MLLSKESPRVLAIGAHPDDIELGAGGFVYRLKSKCEAAVTFLVLTAGVQHITPGDAYEPSTRREESIRAAGILGIPQGKVEVLEFPDCKLHDFGHEIIREIERQLYGQNRSPSFDIVLTHAGEDTHADHRVVHESTLSAVRDFHGTVLCYQAPSTKPNGFHPTFFVRLDKDEICQKDLAIQAHVSQREKEMMRIPRTIGMASNWGVFLRLPTGTYLEAFEVYKSYF
jgi:LmbE family N-acetylglucosaminyl deacetylase